LLPFISEYFFPPNKKVKITIRKTIILPVTLYGCGREEHRLWVFENGELGRIFEPKREEVTRSWRKLHSEELHNLRFTKYY
jgi:hypothetical protein